eukprot:CAMPEP_0205962222 /NCGR_PEP_ID=MMETSP1459-20131121/70486_1 /ASSEMBLY_ACC=CAM_ASM_001120 /TAXON_ID=41880 /ORGANISM="Pycnococcus provasolii, Strain RCC931" /LENGTH=360 /DNA_ID=CAMNT_0053334997 /DNA_START=458 /DNA_END=1540 /DNA_ORIENTATION=+
MNDDLGRRDKRGGRGGRPDHSIRRNLLVFGAMSGMSNMFAMLAEDNDGAGASSENLAPRGLQSSSKAAGSAPKASQGAKASQGNPTSKAQKPGGYGGGRDTMNDDLGRRDKRGGRGGREDRGRGERGGGRGGGRGGRRGENGEMALGERPNRPPRREYDRQSGSGRDERVKRGGAGKGNWGRDADGTAEVAEEEDREPTEEELAKMEEDRKEREKEEKQMTLEDFEKLREEKKKAIEDMMGSKKTVAPAKSDFSGMAAVAKADLEEEITGIELTTGRKEKALKEKAQKEKTKQMLAASFRVASETDYAPARRDRDDDRRGRGRGRGDDRRGGGGGGGRGRGRGGPGMQIQVNDSSFPALG